MIRKTLTGAVVAAVAAAAVAAGAGTASAAPATKFPGDGAWRVGADIAPGVYVGTGQAGCYWKRMSGWYNGLDDVIASGYTHAPQVYVQISPSDVGFASERCGTWTRMPDGFTPPPPPPEPPLLIPLPWPLPPIDPVAAIAGIATNLPAVIGGALVGSVVLPILGPALAYGSLASGSVNPESVDSGSVNPESVASWEGSVMGG